MLHFPAIYCILEEMYLPHILKLGILYHMNLME